MRQFVKSTWQSPTLNTWLNLTVQSLAFLILLPLSVRSLSEATVSVLFLLLSVIGLQAFLNFGFQPTFARLIAYANGGLSVEDMADLRTLPTQTPSRLTSHSHENEQSLSRVCGVMRVINLRIAWIAVLFLITLGSLALVRPIGQLALSIDGWLAWGIVISGTYLRIRFSTYQIYLTGSGHVALVQRWQALVSTFSLGSMLVALSFSDMLSVIFLAHQIWILPGLWNYSRMAKHLSRDRFPQWEHSPRDPFVLTLAWKNAWRSGLGIVSGKLSQQSLGFLYAQFGSSASVATFLIAMRMIEAIESFAMAPFYSQLPRLNRLKAEDRQQDMEALAVRGMRRAHWIYVLGFIAAALIGPILLNQKGSDISFPQPLLWVTLGLAFMFQRLGGMHLQLYSTTNHIIWHWVSLIQGGLTLALTAVLMPGLGALGIALSILLGNLAYAAISANASRTQLQRPLVSFESFSFFPALAAFCLFAWIEAQFAFTDKVHQLLAPILELVLGSLS